MNSVLTNDDVTHGVWNGDCLKLLPTLSDASVHFVLTDPPYITHYRSRDGRRVPNDNPAFAELYRVLKPDSFAVSFYGWPKTDRFLTAFREAGFRVVGHFVFPKRYTSKTSHVRYQYEAPTACSSLTTQPIERNAAANLSRGMSVNSSLIRDIVLTTSRSDE